MAHQPRALARTFALYGGWRRRDITRQIAEEAARRGGRQRVGLEERVAELPELHALALLAPQPRIRAALRDDKRRFLQSHATVIQAWAGGRIFVVFFYL